MTMKYAEMDWGTMEAVVNKLGGMDAVERILSETAEVVIKAISEKVTRLISGAEAIELDPTDGTETIAKAKDTFTGWLDPDFENYGTNVPSPATPKMNVAVHETVKNGTFAQIFGSMSEDLNSLCLTQPQIVQFVKKSSKWLCTGGYATFFLFKVGDEFFVARVSFGVYGRLFVDVYRFSYDRVWNAEDALRVVVPQQPREP